MVRATNSGTVWQRHLFAAVVALCLWGVGCDEPEHRPIRSTILIVIDTVRADHLSSYGYTRDTSPEFDRFARRAAVFDHAIASSSWTLPSFASIYTGRHPQRHGAGEILPGDKLNIAGIGAGLPTLAEILRDAGFATVAYANNPFLHPKFGVARGFRDYFFVPASNTNIRTAKKTVNLALAWIDQHLLDQPERPFFAMVHLFDPHMDYNPPPRFRGRFAGDYTGPLPFPVSKGARMRMGLVPMTDADRDYVTASYDEELAYTDGQLGKFLAGLQSRGLMQNANIIVTSDHGEELFERGSFEHGHSGFQELLHVPLAIWGPEVKAGRIREAVSHVDLFATILEASGLELPEDLTGQSLVRAAEGRGTPDRRPILSDRTLHGRRHRVLIRWPYKAIDVEGQTRGMLFDLEEDPGETRNLADRERGRFDEMMAEFERRSPTPDRSERDITAADLDDAIRAQLESLGYATPSPQASDETSDAEKGTEAESPNGRWLQVEPESRPGSEGAGLIEQLLAIGYLRGSRAEAKRGVTIHDRKKAAQGYNLYVSGHAPEAILMDMDGRVLHRWYFEFESAFPPLSTRDKQQVNNTKWWRRVAIRNNGDLFAIFEGYGLIKIDKDSKLIWSSDLHVHHDLDIRSNGNIFALTRKAHVLPRLDTAAPVLEDFITVFKPDGRVMEEFSVLETLENSRFRKLADFSLRSHNGDLFHTNTLELLPGRTEKRSPLFQRNNILVSMNRLGVVAVIDPVKRVVVWARKTNPIGQHDPKMLPSGNMLLFVNNMDSGNSTVLEFDPTTEERIWSYGGSEAQPLYSKYLGAAERLWNGNTLITESDGGRAFEVTPEHEIVWEFYNPHRAGQNEEFIATLPELIRLPPTYQISWSDAATP